MQNSNGIHLYETRRIPNDPPPGPTPCFTERTGPFCDDNPSNILANLSIYRDHNAHVILPLTIYRHKTKNANPKKKSTGKTTFFIKVPRPGKLKIIYPHFSPVFCKTKFKVPFLGDQI